MPRSYEMTLVLNSQLEDGGVDGAVKRYVDFLESQDAKIVNVDRWGVRKLAYKIGRHQQGDYSIIQFVAEPGVVAELDRLCRLDESVMRQMVTYVEEGYEIPGEEKTDEEKVETPDEESVGEDEGKSDDDAGSDDGNDAKEDES